MDLRQSGTHFFVFCKLACFLMKVGAKRYYLFYFDDKQISEILCS